MKTSRKIVDVNFISRIEKPIVVFELEGAPALVRNANLVLVDMQNNARLPLSVKSVHDPRFNKALQKLRNVVLIADLTWQKAGTAYTIDANHPDVARGVAKAGEARVTKEDGWRVEGFISLPLTAFEQMIEAKAEASAAYEYEMMNAFSGFSSYSAPSAGNDLPEPEVLTPEVIAQNEILDEAFGKSPEQQSEPATEKQTEKAPK